MMPVTSRPSDTATSSMMSPRPQGMQQHWNTSMSCTPVSSTRLRSLMSSVLLATHCCPNTLLKKGLKVFGKAGAEAVTKEVQQLHDRGVLEPKHFGELTREQRVRALAYLMFLKQKRDASIKGRGCADGRKQHDWMTKEDSASPTVANQALNSHT